MKRPPDLPVGLIDSGVSGVPAAVVLAARGFECSDAGIAVVESRPDRAGHGSALAGVILEQAPDISLYSAQVFRDRLTCNAAQVARALDWLVASGVRLVNMSFGLRQDREVLRESCAAALAAGVVLVAASPARGNAVFPASYPGVIRASGDARCARNELSVLSTDQADFGAHVRCQHSTVAGASVGCARVSGFCARFLRDNPNAGTDELRAWLQQQASYFGPERKLAP